MSAARKVALVAAGHPTVVAAAGRVLRAGGNAYDAAVAGGFAAAVSEPGYTSLGGGGFLLARTREGRETLFDFFVDTPGSGRIAGGTTLAPHLEPLEVRFAASTQTFLVGRGSVAVPGCLAGYLCVHAKLGRLPLAEVVAPAVDLARDGVVVNAEQAYVLRVLAPVLMLEEDGRAIYAPAGRILAEGETLRNPDFAEFLLRLPEQGRAALYDGDDARAIARDIRAGGGLLTERDLAAYAVRERAPLAFEYRGRRVLTNPAPSQGGGLLALASAILEPFDLNARGFGSVVHLARLAAAMREVEALRARGIRSPDELGVENLAAGRERVRVSTAGTTHISVVDADGNAASMTTSNGECSGYIAPGTGVMLNNMMGEEDLHCEYAGTTAPGVRVASMMSPIVVLREDRVELVAGSGGSKRIRSALFQVLGNVVDFAMPVRDAVDAPRIHWDGSRLQVEPGFAGDSIDRVGRFFDVNLWPALDFYFGGVHAVVPGAGGAGDPRRGGVAAEIEVGVDA